MTRSPASSSGQATRGCAARPQRGWAFPVSSANPSCAIHAARCAALCTLPALPHYCAARRPKAWAVRLTFLRFACCMHAVQGSISTLRGTLLWPVRIPPSSLTLAAPLLSDLWLHPSSRPYLALASHPLLHPSSFHSVR